MTLKNTLFLLCTLSLGFVTPTYASDIISCDSFENCSDGSIPVTNALLALEARMDALEAKNTALETDNIALKADNEALNALLAGVSRIEDPNTLQDTLRFTNMNVQVVSGSGATDGAKTGTGNLIIGYNETGNVNGDNRTGSHMLVIGRMNNYSFFGGMVVGDQNETSQRYASVSGGAYNIASGQSASVSGGSFNEASGSNASISGGSSNSASSLYASVSGGEGNTASGEASSISGGQFKTANPDYSYAPNAPDLSSEVADNTNAIAAIGPHFSGDHADLTNVLTTQHHAKFTSYIAYAPFPGWSTEAGVVSSTALCEEGDMATGGGSSLSAVSSGSGGTPTIRASLPEIDTFSLDETPIGWTVTADVYGDGWAVPARAICADLTP